MNKLIYVAFINDHFSNHWKNLSGDLSRSLPFRFDSIPLKIDLRLVYSSERNQYQSTFLLAQIIKHLPINGDKIVGITQVDIFIPILTFLFGEAQLNGKGALVSTYRLADEFYGLPADKEKLYQRTLKEILHELGHTLGLIHCPDFECVMNASTYVENIDLKKNRYCRICEELLGCLSGNKNQETS